MMKRRDLLIDLTPSYAENVRENYRPELANRWSGIAKPDYARARINSLSSVLFFGE
jgi:hypothetical protein